MFSDTHTYHEGALQKVSVIKCRKAVKVMKKITINGDRFNNLALCNVQMVMRTTSMSIM